MCEIKLKKEMSVRCAALYPGCDVAEHGGSWKRMCVELTVRSSLETFQPLKSGGCCMYLQTKVAEDYAKFYNHGEGTYLHLKL